MNDNYVLVTDSSCDIPSDRLKEWQIELVRMPYLFTDDQKELQENNQPLQEFYAQMRSGRVAKTSGINEETFTQAFTKLLEQGKDVLYLAFSSGLSNTYAVGKNVIATLSEKYPERKIAVIDTLAACSGEGLIVYLASQNQARGMSLEENLKDLEEKKLHVCHWFTVDDLVYLKRGGRISATTALLGTALNVKPVLHVDDEGHLIKMYQVHGRKKSLKTMAEELGETIYQETPIFIAHADCLEDAEMLESILKEKYGRKVDLLTDIGPIIGAHAGPGTVALFFLGSHR